jgi:hypothetical protein
MAVVEVDHHVAMHAEDRENDEDEEVEAEDC